MGHFFQVQDDFLDCFGNSEVTGKIGTDIQDNKCSWLAVVCMQRANEEQKQLMIDCYGKNGIYYFLINYLHTYTFTYKKIYLCFFFRTRKGSSS